MAELFTTAGASPHVAPVNPDNASATLAAAVTSGTNSRLPAAGEEKRIVGGVASMLNEIDVDATTPTLFVAEPVAC